LDTAFTHDPAKHLHQQDGSHNNSLEADGAFQVAPGSKYSKPISDAKFHKINGTKLTTTTPSAVSQGFVS
jgi:hypothetical protein